MNYDMQRIMETIPKLFVMLKSTKVEIKEKDQSVDGGQDH